MLVNLAVLAVEEKCVSYTSRVSVTNGTKKGSLELKTIN